MGGSKRAFHLLAVLVVAGVFFAGTAWAQPTITITGAVGVNMGGNQADYYVAGTVANVGNNYTVNVQIWDGQVPPNLICSKQISKTDGSGTWYVDVICAAGGVTAVAQLRDDAGLKGLAEALQWDDEDTAPIEYPIPATTNIGLLILVLSLVSVAMLVLYRRATSRA